MELNDAHDTGEQIAREAQKHLAKALNPRAGEKVCIAYPHLDTFGSNFVESVLRMVAYDKQHGDHLMHNSGIMNTGALSAVWGRSMELSHARNTAAAAFMSSDADWLLWWDTDIGAEPDALEKLLEAADPVTAPIVGGLCFIEGDYSHDFRGGLRASLAPTLYDWAWIEPDSGMPGAYKMITRQEWVTNEVTRVGATGTGFLLIHRSAFEKISDWLRSSGPDVPGHIWFERIPGPDGELCGEDISFCMRANQVDLPVYVHTGVTTTHQKTAWYGVPDYRMKPFAPPPMTVRPLPPDQWPKLMINPNAAADAERNSPIREKQVPEALETVAVIVPVAKRDNAATFLGSLHDSLTPGQRGRVRVYVMADDGDLATEAAWYGQQDLYPNVDIHPHPYLRDMGSFGQKANHGYDISTEEWLFFVGDDVKFHRGWLDQALEVARTTGKHVIGTNDLGNTAVMAGEHATHLLIRRTYIEQIGASWDGPGTVCHEGYRHWFVDNEIVEAAKRRNVWAPCLAAHVEHLHPYYGKAAFDDVYGIGEQAAETDHALYAARFQAAEERGRLALEKLRRRTRQDGRPE
jgi:hypothetical protein